MSKKQMMVACPKYDAKDIGCNIDGRCSHFYQHAERADCVGQYDTCPACTPVATPAPEVKSCDSCALGGDDENVTCIKCEGRNNWRPPTPRPSAREIERLGAIEEEGK